MEGRAVTSEYNQALRDHVTQTAFVLTLGRTHIAVLVRLDLELMYERHIHAPWGPATSIGRLLRKDAMAWHGLEDRGLIVHVWPQNEHRHYHENGRRKDPKADIPPSEAWNITRAGRLVLDLLKECGIYQEYAEAIGAAVTDGKPLPYKKAVVYGV